MSVSTASPTRPGAPGAPGAPGTSGTRQFTLPLRGSWPFVPFAPLDEPAEVTKPEPEEAPVATRSVDVGQLPLGLP